MREDFDSVEPIFDKKTISDKINNLKGKFITVKTKSGFTYSGRIVNINGGVINLQKNGDQIPVLMNEIECINSI